MDALVAEAKRNETALRALLTPLEVEYGFITRMVRIDPYRSSGFALTLGIKFHHHIRALPYRFTYTFQDDCMDHGKTAPWTDTVCGWIRSVKDLSESPLRTRRRLAKFKEQLLYRSRARHERLHV